MQKKKPNQEKKSQSKSCFLKIDFFHILEEKELPIFILIQFCHT